MAQEFDVSNSVKYIIRLCIVNKVGCQSIYEYFCNNESPSDIARKLKVSKHMVRGYIQRAEKGFREMVVAGIDVCRNIYNINSMFHVEVGDGWIRCPLCGEKIYSKEALMAHIRIKHKDVVDLIIKNIIQSRELYMHTPSQPP